MILFLYVLFLRLWLCGFHRRPARVPNLFPDVRLEVLRLVVDELGALLVDGVDALDLLAVMQALKVILPQVDTLRRVIRRRHALLF